jgi:murein DD-endopeptidase MepM/ murein hydrolase activator NlpD
MQVLWRVLVTVLLLAILVAVLWRRELIPSLPILETPHEAYARSLSAAGLADTALGRDWKASAERALSGPEAATLPLKSAVEHDAAQPRAYGYRFELRRGRVIVVEAAFAPADARVFIDLFRVEEDGGMERVESAGEDSRRLEYEARRDGTYIVRVQPELLRGGTLQVGGRTVAALTFPVAGRDAAAVKSYFRDPRDGGRRDHHGVDIFAPRDTPVVAAADGLVTSVGTNRLGGNVVWVWDPARRQSHYYAHLSSQAVGTGTRVRAGEVVGYVGNTGNARSTPPHLHFGIYALGEGPVDPLPFVQGARGPQPDSTGTLTKPAQETTGIGG